MAGTRLLLQGIFAAEFLLLIVAAVTIGLIWKGDSISHHLPYYQSGRSKIQHYLQRLQDIPNPEIPRIPIATAQEHVALLAKLVAEAKELDIQVTEEKEMEIDKICRIALDGGDVPEKASHHSIWICPSIINQDGNSASVVVRDGITIIYPSKTKPLDMLWDSLQQSIPINQPLIRRSLKVSLLVESRRDWTEWAGSLEEWIRKEKDNLLAWPCVRGTQIEAQVVLSRLENYKADSSKQQQKKSNISNPISMTAVKDYVMDHFHSNEELDVVLFLPKTTPATFVDGKKQSKAMSVDNTFIATIDQPEVQIKVTEVIAEETMEGENGTTITRKITQEQREEIPVPIASLIAEALIPLDGFLLETCMSVISTDMKIDTDHSLPLWYVQAWWQLILKNTYEKSTQQVKQEGLWLLESSTWVVIDEQMAHHWETMVEWIQQASNMTDNYQEALHLLEDTLSYVKMLRNDPALMEPLRFSPPQFMAIFAPLCLPLLLPHLLGLIREWKRYKKLCDKKAELGNTKEKSD